MEKLHWANDYIEDGNLEEALSQFNKILFYDKRSKLILTKVPEVYAEKAEIYIMLCDFSSAIAHFKKALALKYV